MAEVFADHLLGVPKSQELGRTLERAFIYAEEQGHAEVLLDHLLLALTEDRDAASVIAASAVDLNRLRNDVAGFVSRNSDRLPPNANAAPLPSEELLRVIDAAAAAASQSHRAEINGAMVLAALIGEGQSPAAKLLRSHGLTFEEAVRTLQRRPAPAGARQQPAARAAPSRPRAIGHAPPPRIDARPEQLDWAQHQAPTPAMKRGRPIPKPALEEAAVERQVPRPARPARPPASSRGPSPDQPSRERAQVTRRPGRSGGARREAVGSGMLAQNIPRRMTAGRPVAIEVRVARRDVEGLTEGMRGPGAPAAHEIFVTKAMSVRLRAPEGGFTIESASPETQWIDNELGLYDEDFASWHWSATPKKSGRASLQIIVSARSVAADGITAETALPEQTVEVVIGIDYGRAIKRIGFWALTMLAGGVLGALGEGVIRRLL